MTSPIPLAFLRAASAAGRAWRSARRRAADMRKRLNLSLAKAGCASGALRDCAAGQDWVRAMELIQAGARDSLGPRGEPSALMLAARAGRLDIVQALAEDPDFDPGAASAPEGIVLSGPGGFIGKLLPAGDALRQKSGATALFWACLGNSPECTAFLSGLSDPCRRNLQGWTPLSLSCACGHPEAAQILLPHYSRSPALLREALLMCTEGPRRHGHGECRKLVQAVLDARLESAELARAAPACDCSPCRQSPPRARL